jgi:hypothetical protein
LKFPEFKRDVIAASKCQVCDGEQYLYKNDHAEKHICKENRMQEVKSSNIAKIGYDDATNTLKVQFKKGGEYHYLEVPAEVHSDLMKAESIGSFFSKNVRNTYKFVKAEPDGL